MKPAEVAGAWVAEADPVARAFTLDELRTATFPARPSLLNFEQDGILRAGDVAELYADRGTGKSLLASSIGLAVATGADVLRWWAPRPSRVLLVDGEMPGEMIRERLMTLAAGMKIDSCDALSVVAADWQESPLPRLDTPAGQAAIEPHITDDTALVILDNASCLLDPESEKDPSAWQPALEWLLSLRRRGIATLLVHHSNRMGGARGHSRREDAMDVILKLSRPDGYSQDEGARFRVEFAKSRGFYGQAAAPFVARLTDGAWTTEDAVTFATPSRLRSDILAYVSTHPGASKTEVVANVVGREQITRNELESMAGDRLLNKSEGRFYVA